MTTCSGYIQGFLLPSSDKTLGDWSIAPLYLEINSGIDSSQSDNTSYVETLSFDPSAPFEVNLQSGVTAIDNSCHILKYIASIDAYYGSESVPLRVDLFNDSTLIKSHSTTLTSTSWVTGIISLSTGEASSIFDYGMLSVRVSGSNSPGGNTPRIAEIEFQYPTGSITTDEPSNIYPEAFLLFV